MCKLLKPKAMCIALSLSLAILPFTGHAITLGEVEVHTRLNHPLKATIPLLSLTEEEAGIMNVRVADAATFERMGVPYDEKVERLNIKIKKDKSSPHIEITTHNNLREPMLDVILSIDLDNNSLVRRYTLMLEPHGI